LGRALEGRGEGAGFPVFLQFGFFVLTGAGDIVLDIGFMRFGAISIGVGSGVITIGVGSGVG
jgi:hypothetical protein